jgi:aryl-alcohol dehydrogenase-like predicted oxidoreductase
MTTARRLGRTDVEVPPIGSGRWQFSGGLAVAGRFWEAIPRTTASELVDAALAGGIRLFDTAEVYANGESERRLSAALLAAGKKPGEVTVATKWSPIECGGVAGDAERVGAHRARQGVEAVGSTSGSGA